MKLEVSTGSSSNSSDSSDSDDSGDGRKKAKSRRSSVSDRLKVRLAKEKDDKKKMVEKLKECKSLLTETKEKFRKWRHRHPHAKETSAYSEGSASVKGDAMLELLAAWALQHDSTSELHTETVENKVATNNTQRISLVFIYIYSLLSMYLIRVFYFSCFLLFPLMLLPWAVP